MLDHVLRRVLGGRAVLLACAACVAALSVAGAANADYSSDYCPASGGGTISIAPGTDGMCVHTIQHDITQVHAYRLNNGDLIHCAGGHDTTSRYSTHVIPYACGAGSAGTNGHVATSYNGTGTYAYPIHKNDACCTFSGFYGWYAYVA